MSIDKQTNKNLMNIYLLSKRQEFPKAPVNCTLIMELHTYENKILFFTTVLLSYKCIFL